ncbi:hypothetical protein BC940DRAFT_288978 [Gongronella butleri]|nr:hypothetical protein BC940DRAFT_288978 [Gongronella butleri]
MVRSLFAKGNTVCRACVNARQITKKKCASCWETLPLTDFSRNQRKIYKDKACCKMCVGLGADNFQDVY